ncbi:MAG: plastocyanin/azurin family copper-binding protein [Verrucomicrobiales bacterium]|nr:plastocyanin/azurin family copper-binding protein [Verrucomicrobiales bacterium]
MKSFSTTILPLLAIALLTHASGEEKTHYSAIKAVEGLQFDPVRIKARAGDKLRIVFSNEDPNDQPHNIVIIKPGTLEEIQAASMMVTGDSQAKGFVPESEHIIASSGLLDAGGSDELLINIPKEKGVYHYVCTFPGHAMLMYGAIYAGVSQGSLAADPNIPDVARNAEAERKEALLNVERPGMFRLFMPDAGPAAIAVALPHDFNYCWDAGNGRLRYLWKGDFIDATGLWRSNGNALARVLGDRIWESRAGEKVYGLKFGDTAPGDYHYLGYDLVEETPVFRYQLDGIDITETLTSTEDSLRWSFTVTDPATDIRVLAPATGKISITAEVGERDGDWWVIPQEHASAFTLTLKES